MQDTIWQPIKYKNAFCDVEGKFVFETLPLQNAIENDFGSLNLSLQDCRQIYKSTIQENIKNNVAKLSILVSNPFLAAEILEELDINATIVMNVKNSDALSNTLLEDFKRKYKFPLAIYIPQLLDLSEEEIENIVYLAGKEKITIYINFLRSLEEAGSLDKIYGKSPAKVLEEFGCLDRECYLVGCNFLDKDDAQILSSYNTKIILTPLEDMLLGQGFVNLKMLFEQGLKINLGSGIHNCLEMQSQAKIALGNTANLMYDPFPILEEEYKSLFEI